MYPRDKKQRDSIINFNPVDRLVFKSDKPVYYCVDGELRFSEHGTFDLNHEVIYRDGETFEKEVKGAFVSPNGQFILIYQTGKLVLLENNGRQTDLIRNVTFSNPTAGNFDALSVQWTKDSQSFFILYFEKPQSSEIRLNTILFKYSIERKNLDSVFNFSDEIHSFHYHLTHENNAIVFRALHGPSYKKFHTDSPKGKLSPELTLIPDIKKIFKDLYISFQTRATFEHGGCTLQSYDLKNIIFTDRTGLYLSKLDTIDRILEVQAKSDFEVKTMDDINLSESYFLPGNRYVIVQNVNAEEYQGSLVIDTETLTYAKVPFKLKTYFNINTDDFQNDLTLDNFGFKVEPAVDMSMFYGFRTDIRNGKATIDTLNLPKPNLRDSIEDYKKRNSIE